jgi:RNA polymerase II elongation factor ELL
MGVIYIYHNYNFRSKYTSIRTPEQKSRYKAEFNADYKEYRKLHSVIDQVSKHFAHLEERLLQAEHGSQDYEVSRA